MAILHRSEVPLPTEPEEETFVAEFGGEVIVKSLSLRARLAMSDEQSDGTTRMTSMLHHCVVDAERQPIYTQEQWETFAGRHMETAMRLWDTARTLSGLKLDEEGEKKEASPVD